MKRPTCCELCHEFHTLTFNEQAGQWLCRTCNMRFNRGLQVVFGTEQPAVFSWNQDRNPLAW